MRCFVTGATGLVGARLLPALVQDGHDVVALSRGASRSGAHMGGSGADTGGSGAHTGRSCADTGVEWIQGDPATGGSWESALADCEAVVHLAGEPIAARRWSSAQKQRLVTSRVESTLRLAQTISGLDDPPAVFVCASAVGFYGPRGEEELDEASAPGDDFLAQLCADWEAAATHAESGGTRVVSLRIGIVLAPGGGALEKLLPPFRLGLGGPIGPADRWFPWVHVDDVVGLIRFALDGPVRGPVNAVAPGAVRMGDLARTLGRVLGRPAVIPVPLAPLRLVLGEFAAHVSPGQKIVPAAARKAGYAFVQPDLEPALRDCVG